jgi:hypothetical protein
VDINPLVNWVWMGFGLLALGIGIALLPDAAFAFATAPLPANAATTALILLAVVLSQGVVLAQDTVPAIFRSPLERRVAEEVMCNCGCRLSVANCGMMNCHGKEQQSAKIRQYVGEGQGSRRDPGDLRAPARWLRRADAAAEPRLQPRGLAAAVRRRRGLPARRRAHGSALVAPSGRGGRRDLRGSTPSWTPASSMSSETSTDKAAPAFLRSGSGLPMQLSSGPHRVRAHVCLDGVRR